MGYGLITLVDSERDGALLERIKTVRRQMAQELGVIVPPLRIRDNLELKPGEYTILIKGIEVARSELMLGHYLAMHPGEEPQAGLGIPTIEPAFGLPAVWVNTDTNDQAQLAGYTVVDVPTVIITHLTEVMKRHLHEVLSREEVQKLLKRFAETSPKVVEELVPTLKDLLQQTGAERTPGATGESARPGAGIHRHETYGRTTRAPATRQHYAALCRDTHALLPAAPRQRYG